MYSLIWTIKSLHDGSDTASSTTDDRQDVPHDGRQDGDAYDDASPYINTNDDNTNDDTSVLNKSRR